MENKKYVIGADIGGTTVKLGLFEEDGTLLEKWEIPTVIEGDGTAVLRDIAAVKPGKAAAVAARTWYSSRSARVSAARSFRMDAWWQAQTARRVSSAT